MTNKSQKQQREQQLSSLTKGCLSLNTLFVKDRLVMLVQTIVKLLKEQPFQRLANKDHLLRPTVRLSVCSQLYFWIK